jgi:hypothetical protein
VDLASAGLRSAVSRKAKAYHQALGAKAARAGRTARAAADHETLVEAARSVCESLRRKPAASIECVHEVRPSIVKVFGRPVGIWEA